LSVTAEPLDLDTFPAGSEREPGRAHSTPTEPATLPPKFTHHIFKTVRHPSIVISSAARQLLPLTDVIEQFLIDAVKANTEAFRKLLRHVATLKDHEAQDGVGVGDEPK